MMTWEEYAVRRPMAGPVTAFRRDLIERYITPSMRVLDVGCGDGRHLECVARICAREQLAGTEISRVRVERVKARGFRCELVDGVTLPFNDDTFEGVLLFEVIEHVPHDDVPRLLREIVRVLRPGGIVLGSTPNYPIKRVHDVISRLSALPGRAASRVGSRRLIASPSVSVAQFRLPTESLWRRLRCYFADDPTHQFHCNFTIIGSLGRRHLPDVQLFRTHRGSLKSAATSWLGSRTSRKVVFAFRVGPLGSTLRST